MREAWGAFEQNDLRHFQVEMLRFESDNNLYAELTSGLVHRCALAGGFEPAMLKSYNLID